MIKRRPAQALILIAALMLPLSSQANQAKAQQLPLWELGLGVGAFSMPHYMGSDERYTYPFAFPYPVYRGKRWWLDRSGLRGRLFNLQQLSLDLSASGGLPVKNSNQARQGMPSLYLTAEVGPRLNWIFYHQHGHDLRFMLPWRAAFDIKGRYLGSVSEPSLQYIYQVPHHNGWLRLKLETGVLYASQTYNTTYYGVAPQYATATRPVYQANGGLHSGLLHASLRYPLNHDWQLFFSGRLRDLGMGVVSDSPLVRNKMYTTASAGVIWMFARSDEAASGEE